MNPFFILSIFGLFLYIFNLFGLSDVQGRFAPSAPYRQGMLQVDELHTIYWEECGNPDGIPVLFLHGGPGVPTDENSNTFFNPSDYRIILFDQRGCGKTTPNNCLTNNTTWDLVEDIDKLRKHLSIDRFLLFGGSWGSTLALTYAIKYPENVSEMILRGIFLCNQNEIDWFFRDGANHYSPEAWNIFTGGVSNEKLSDVLSDYHDRLHNGSYWTKISAAASWVLWEFANLQSVPNPQLKKLIDYQSLFCFFTFLYSRQNLTMALIENHYFINKGFFPNDNWIIDNIDKIQNIPGVIIHGEFDRIIPKESAIDLHQHWPASKLLIIPNSGHASTEPGISDALMEAVKEFKETGSFTHEAL